MPNGPGNITKLTEWGWDVVVVEERCIVDVNPGNTGNGGGGNLAGGGVNSRSSDFDAGDTAREAKYVVYDISGRPVFQGISLFDKADVIRQFRESAGDIPAGLYFIQLSDGVSKETVKVFYSR